MTNSLCAAFTEPPFTCKNEGWGEFEMSIDMFTTEKGGKTTVFHDLNFQSPRYEVLQTVTFKNPSQALLNILRETGPVSTEEDPKVNKVRKANDGKKRKTQWDFEKMADAMTKLDEDDLLHVIQMIHDHKNDETYTKNDMEMGEFSVDLFTLPDNLSRMIWEFLVSLHPRYSFTTHTDVPIRSIRRRWSRTTGAGIDSLYIGVAWGNMGSIH